MSRWLITINTDADRARAIQWARAAKYGMRVEFKQAKRTTPQNDRMWAMLTDVAVQLKWHGKTLTPDEWKLQFLDSLRRSKGEELRIVPNLDNTGFVDLGKSSSDLSKEEMTDLIELIFAFGANPEHPVTFNEPKQVAA